MPIITNTQGKLAALYQFLFQKDEGAVPDKALPSHKTDLFQLKPDEDVIVWMGHSSYFIQIDGVKILIDPVFSNNASPVPAINVAFKGSNIYSAEDIPEIDYLLISHDHWDHLDYPTIDSLRDKIKHVVTPIGVGSYFTQWDFPKEKISEDDWYHTVIENSDIKIDVLPAQHFSGRFFTKNQTLWGSFAVITKNHQLYLGGDSGYGPHFKEIGKRYGSFDIAILECGQYNENWPYIHMMPEQTAQAAVDLNAKSMLPVHNSKFKLSHHTWQDPIERIITASLDKPYRLMTPEIGNTIWVDNPDQVFTRWWKTNEQDSNDQG